MSAKIQLKSDLVGTFGGIFLMLDHFNKAGLDKLVDKLLGNRRFNAKYSYSDIFKTLLATYATNGSCIEDSRRISGQISEKSQDYRLCSPDILLNSFKELCTGSSASHSESGIEYRFNHNPALTSLAVKGLIQCGQVDTKTAHVFDYDNQFIPTEKYDAKFSYKKAFGYFPGIAQIDGYPFFVENRDGNANVKYLSFTDVAESRHSKQACSTLDFCNIQAETLEKAYLALEENGVKVGSRGWTAAPIPRRSSRPWPGTAVHSISGRAGARRCGGGFPKLTIPLGRTWRSTTLSAGSHQYRLPPSWRRRATGSSCSAP